MKTKLKDEEQVPGLILGTAMWGWTISKPLAFQLLDLWYSAGLREVDCATNYPINKNVTDFRLSENILIEWIKAHGITDLEVIMKVGSLNNLKTPEHILTQSFLLIMLDEYRWLLGNNLGTFMVHWDDRDELSAIRETFEAFREAQNLGMQIGISGVRHPELYHELNKEYEYDFRIQFKHNLLQSDYSRYSPFHGKRHFIAYGINAGGLKLNESEYSKGSTLLVRGADKTQMDEVRARLNRVLEKSNRNANREQLTAFHQLGMIYAYYHNDMDGILVGPSCPEQLSELLEFYQSLGGEDFRDVYDDLCFHFNESRFIKA